MKVELDLSHHELADWVKANRAAEEQHKACMKWVEDNRPTYPLDSYIMGIKDKDWISLYDDLVVKQRKRDDAQALLSEDIFYQLKLKDFQVFTSEE